MNKSSSNNKETYSRENSVRTARELLQNGEVNAAIAYCLKTIKESGSILPIELILNQSLQANAQFDSMLEHIRELARLNPKHPVIQVRLVECLIYCGEMLEAISSLDLLAKKADKNHQLLTKIAELFLHAAQYERVVECHKQALECFPNNLQYQYNLATSLIFVGELEQAEKLLDDLILKQPKDFDAYYALSTIKKQSVESNNIPRLKSAITKYKNKPESTISLGFALAKELEDIGEYRESFLTLKLAASMRRKKMRYQVSHDVEALKNIREVFGSETIDSVASSKSIAAPIFIVGLPRSGTTLVDRILSSHSNVGSLGEINNFAFSLIHSVGPHNGKLDLIKRSVSVDLNLLADRYINATEGYGVEDKHLIDKTPLNFLYLGLIKKALPNARIIHLQRAPMDSCYAMYKTLFRMGYPFSYSLDDLGQYYIAYNQLLAHWRHVFPGGFYDLSYQELVEDSEQTIKKLLQYCQLDWQENVLNFHQNNSATATASAAQVRNTFYTSSIGKWKHYHQQLTPLVRQLESAGIIIE